MNYCFFYISSLCLNALLVLGLVYQQFNRDMAEKNAAPAQMSSPQGSKTTGLMPAKIINVLEERFTWEELNAADYQAYVKNLRALGCPEITVQDIIYAVVDKVYARKIRELNQRLRIGRDGQSFDFWAGYGAHHEALKERTRKLMELNLERDALLFSLLGVDVEKERQMRHGLPEKNMEQSNFLTPHQTRYAREIVSGFQLLEVTVTMKYGRYTGEEPFAERAALARESDAELLKIMSAAQLEEYKLQKSPVAQRLRRDLAMAVSDQEFRALYKIDEKYDRSYQPPLDWDDPAVMKKLLEVNARKEEEMRMVISDPQKRELIIYELKSRRGKDL